MGFLLVVLNGRVIVILGGAAEGRRLAAALPDAMVSLAGRTERPALSDRTRRGGFGGAEGLASFLRQSQVTAVLDATHPFAGQMHHNAAAACAETGTPLLRVERPSWAAHPDAEGWSWVASHEEAAGEAATTCGPVFLTVGRQHTLDYVGQLTHRAVVARLVEAPAGALPPSWRLLTARGPFSLDGERALFREHRFGCLVTKDSGGPHTDAKLTAAAEAGATVVMIRRPQAPPGVATVGSVDAALEWVAHLPTPT